MITLQKIKIYKKYSGNIENWDRFGKMQDKGFLEYEEWELIDELIQNLELVQNGLTSACFKKDILHKLNDVCDSEKTQQELKSLIGKYK